MITASFLLLMSLQLIKPDLAIGLNVLDLIEDLTLDLEWNEPLSFKRSQPESSSVDVATDSEIRLTFSHPVDITSLRGALHIEGTQSGMIEWDVSDAEAGVVVLKPRSEFSYGEWITVRIDESLAARSGSPLKEAVLFEFRVRTGRGNSSALTTSLLESGAEGPRFTFSSDSEAELTYEVLLGKAEHLATRKLGVDVVQLQRMRVGAVSRLAIQTGWYLSPKTFFSIMNEVEASRPKTYFMLEYALNEELDLVVTQGNDSRQGVDLQWRRNY